MRYLNLDMLVGYKIHLGVQVIWCWCLYVVFVSIRNDLLLRYLKSIPFFCSDIVFLLQLVSQLNAAEKLET
jgi:hypothetical protein